MSSQEIEDKVLAEINLTQESLGQGVNQVIEWISKQPHLPDLTDREIVKAFIVGSKSVSKAKERLEKYYKVRAKYPVFFADRDPKLIKWMAAGMMFKLPGVTPEGQIVFFIPPVPEERLKPFDYVESLKVIFMTFDTVFMTDPVISGQYIVYDCQKMPLELVIKCLAALSHVPASFNIYQNSLPIRLKGFICFNASTVAEYFVNNLLKVFFNKKLRERIFVHSDDHSVLSQYIPMDMLPSDYGGSGPSIQQLLEDRQTSLESKRDWFLNEGNMKADKSKKHKKSCKEKNISKEFKNLEID